MTTKTFSVNDGEFELSVFINTNDKIAIKSFYGYESKDDFSIVQLDIDDAKELIKELKLLIKGLSV